MKGYLCNTYRLMIGDQEWWKIIFSIHSYINFIVKEQLFFFVVEKHTKKFYMGRGPHIYRRYGMGHIYVVLGMGC